MSRDISEAGHLSGALLGDGRGWGFALDTVLLGGGVALQPSVLKILTSEVLGVEQAWCCHSLARIGTLGHPLNFCCVQA